VDELVGVVEDAAAVVDGAALDLQFGVDLVELVADRAGGFLAEAREAEEGSDCGRDCNRYST
jgi:hypothetical protein